MRLRRVSSLALLWLVVTSGCQSGTKPGPSRTDLNGASEAVPAAWLNEVPRERFGINFQHIVGDFEQHEMPAIMGSGCALVDSNRDGRLEIYFVNGQRRGAGRSNPVQDAFLTRFADGHFEDRFAQTGISSREFGMGAWWGDFDQDGFPDLFLTNYGRNQLFHNLGDGTYLESPLPTEVAAEAWSTAACWTDLNGDGLLDLFVVNYVDYLPGQYCDGADGGQEFCGPSTYTGTVDQILINTGSLPENSSSLFADQTVARGVGNITGRGLAAIADDFNRDGRIDLYVSNDMESNRLWIQNEKGQFSEQATLLGVANNFLGEVEASMGTVAHDWNDDGIPDLFLCHLTGETNTMYLSESDSGMWQDNTAATGLGPAGLALTSFGVAAIDLEHDGDLDLLLVNGGVKRDSRSRQTTEPKQAYAQHNSLYLCENESLQFTPGEALGASYAQSLEVSRGLASGDLDADGDVDFVVSNCSGPGRVYLNSAPKSGYSLIIRLVDCTGNRDAIGATVRVHAAAGRMFQRKVNPQQGYLSQHETAVHCGLGELSRYDRIEIKWPDGATENFPGGRSNQRILLVRGQGQHVLDSYQ